MATIIGLTAERMREIEAASIVDGTIDVNGHLILTRYDGQTIDAGSAMVSVPSENLVHFLDRAGYAENTPPGGYPDGLSIMRLDDVESTADWPTFAGRFGTVATVNHRVTDGNDFDTNQTWTLLSGTAGTQEQWIRSGNGSGFGAWKRIALKADVDAVNTALGSTNTTVTGIDNRVKTLENARNLGDDAFAETALGSSYPLGVSLMSNVAASWSVGFGMIVTNRISDTRTNQVFHGNNFNGMWKRYFYSGTWGPWVPIYDDTGWVNLTPASGWASSPTSTQYVAAVRRMGSLIRFRGVLNGTLTVSTTTQIATVPSTPAGLRPLKGTNFNPVLSTGAFLGWSNVDDLGALTIHFKAPFATGSIVVDLTGISYTKD